MPELIEIEKAQRLVLERTSALEAEPVPLGHALGRVEDTRASSGRVEMLAAAEPGRDIRRAGEDVKPSALMISGGTALGPAELGVRASLGRAEDRLKVQPRSGLPRPRSGGRYCLELLPDPRETNRAPGLRYALVPLW